MMTTTAMATLRLREHAPTFGVPLTQFEVDALRRSVPSLEIQPTLGHSGAYDLRPGAHVGVLQMGDLTVEIRPKLPISRVLFLLSYVSDKRWWRDDEVRMQEDRELFEVLIPGFARQVHRALRRGLLQGYQTREEALPLVRGRIRFDDQIRRRERSGEKPLRAPRIAPRRPG